jgi:hypothetical protein
MQLANELANTFANDQAEGVRGNVGMRHPGHGGEPGGEFRFTSAVGRERWDDVESLFFFHPRQRGLIEPIRRSVEAWGTPEILRRDNRIYLGIPKHDAQCLFACHRRRAPQRPVGVVLYLRPQPEVLSLLHLAVGPEYTHDGAFGDLGLAQLLVSEVRHLARRVAGVRRIQLPYCEERYLPVMARHSA